ALVNRFGASRITIGHALRELQQRGLIDRIAGSGTYVRPLKGQRREGLLFGLIIPNLGETEIFEPICHAIAASPDANGHALLWGHSDPDSSGKEEEAMQLCDQCIVRGVSGVFFAPVELTAKSAEVNSRVMKRLKGAGIPVVLLDRRQDQTTARDHCDLVGVDNHRAGYIATEHLLRLGARRVGFIAYEHQASTVKTRIRGYQDALAAWHGGDCGSRTFELTADLPMQLPAAAAECDAFVCANDRVAGQLMHMLLGQGIRIPQDVRIVGIDDVKYAPLLPVPLTTVHQPCRDIGETALRTMLERLDRPNMPARDILLDCALVIRKSCGSL
ncbi:MAG: transcriptional regulator, GntR family, partial [Bryobacterales bacterium]|nr:transcriptional regulator, GntR family [Bryobacterales bacterium]